MNASRSPNRKPFALANWKMAMTIPEGLAFLRCFTVAVGTLAQSMDVVLCPPYTALHSLSQALTNAPIDLGAQDLCAAPDNAHTGEISPELLIDAGCRWVMLGHWEVRHHKGESDVQVNKKMLAGLKAELSPILFIGETASERKHAEQVLTKRLPDVFSGCESRQVVQAAVVYEPEWTIGAKEPASPDHIAACCSVIRHWIEAAYGEGAANRARIIYGGSVAPKHAGELLSSPDLDGLGAGRAGRDPLAFAEIVRLIAKAKCLDGPP